MDLPPFLHFYSPAAEVSLELPIGFESGPDGDTGSNYLFLDDDEDLVLARVVVQQLQQDAPVEVVTAAFVAASGELVEERDLVVDDCAVRTVLVRLPPDAPQHGHPEQPVTGPGGDDLVVHFSAAAVDGGVRTVTGFAPWTEKDHWAPIFDEAVASCRFL